MCSSDLTPRLQDKRLRSGDQLLRIGDEDLEGMGTEQVAQVLRNAGNRVKLLIARNIATGTDHSTPTLSLQQETDSEVPGGVRGVECV